MILFLYRHVESVNILLSNQHSYESKLYTSYLSNRVLIVIMSFATLILKVPTNRLKDQIRLSSGKNFFIHKLKYWI